MKVITGYELAPFFMFFQQYYQERLHKLGYHAWQELTDALRKEPAADSPKIRRSLETLNGVTKTELLQMPYDFNRLFVGPAKLLAPPYESAYRNKNGIVMQEETIRVRRFYLAHGLVLANKNQEPDDHIGLELGFILYLLENEQYDSYHLFLQEHLLTWYEEHTDRIRESAVNPVCLGMAELLKEVLDMAKNEFLLTRR